MRPGWLKCEGCLFCSRPKPPDGDDLWPDEIKNLHFCSLSSRAVQVKPENFCGSWVCRRCLQPWNLWSCVGFTDHFTCGEVGNHADPANANLPPSPGKAPAGHGD